MAATEAIETPTSSRKRWLELGWSVLVIALVAYFIYRERTDIQGAIRHVRRADRGWLVFLIVMGLITHAFLTQSLNDVLRAMGKRIPFWHGYSTHMEREMLATIMPLGAIASFVVLQQRFKRFGVSSSDAGIATLLYTVVGNISFLVVALPGIAWFVHSQNANRGIWIALAAIVLTILGLIWLVVSLMQGRQFPPAIERRLPSMLRDLRTNATQMRVTFPSFIPAIVFGVLGNLAGIIAVYAALKCTRVDATWATSTFAYVVGTLFILAAPVFQGIGFVEVSMTAIMVRMGVPTQFAIGATLLYRFVEIWMPSVLGVGIRAQRQRYVSGFLSRFPGIWTIVNGLVALSILLPQRPRMNYAHGPHRHAFPQGGREWFFVRPEAVSRDLFLIFGFLLVVLGIRLLRRQQSAWVITMVVLVSHLVLMLSTSHTTPAMILTVINIGLLVIYRRHFRVRSDLPSIQRGVALLFTGLGVTYVFTVVTLYMMPVQAFQQDFSLVDSLINAVLIFLYLGEDNLIPYSPFAKWSVEAVHILGMVTFLMGMIAILRPIVFRKRIRQQETAHARDLIDRFGDSSLDRFKYWPDKHQFFASNDSGVVSYGVSGRSVIVLGDPSARDDLAREQTLDEFLEYCGVNGWEPAFHQVSPAYLPMYTRRGFESLEIGQEAVVDAANFTLQVPGVKNLRSSWNRAKRENMAIELFNAPVPDAVLDELQEISDAWLTLDGRRERTFTLGQFERDYMRECDVLVLRTADGVAQSFINIIPDGVPGEETFDLMRFRPDAPNGSMDLLMIALLEHARDNGKTHVSLGMVPWVRDESDENDEKQQLKERGLSMISRTMENFFASASLYKYKDKFHPVWEPRYLVTRNWAQLPRAAMALTRLSELPQPDAKPFIGPITSMLIEAAEDKVEEFRAKRQTT